MCKLRQPDPEEERQWWEEFEAASRRSPEQHFRNCFIKTYRPVMDDANFRAFDTMESYRLWCEANLPEWLGYRRCTCDESA